MTLVDHVTKIARKNGPVHRVMGGAWRPLQAEYMIEHARMLSHNSNNYPVTSFEHVEAGIGKTIAYVVVEAANIVLKGRGKHRAICTTFTRNLRKEIYDIGNDGNDYLNRILSEHLADEGSNFPYDPFEPIIIDARTSFTAAASPERAKELRDRAIAEKWNSVETQQVMNYYDFVITAGYESDKLPLLSEWVSAFGVIPTREKVDIKHFALGYDELYRISNNYPVIKEEMARNREAVKGSDILVVTHALFAMNGIEFGSLLNTHQSTSLQDISVVIDEAHLLPEQGNNAFDIKITMNRLDEILKLLRLGKQKTVLEKTLLDITKKTKTTDYAYVNRHSIQKEFVAALTALIHSVEDKTHKKGKPTKAWASLSMVGQIIVEDLMAELKTMISIITQCDGRSTPFANAVKQAQIYNIIHHDAGKRIISLIVKAETPEELVTPSWSSAGLHAITHLTFVSGTLEDTLGSLADFGKKVGIRSTDTPDKRKKITKVDFEIRIPDRATSSVVQGRSPLRFILSDKLDIKPSLKIGDEITPNPEHIDFIIQTLDKHILSQDNTDTTLVLLNSYAALDLMESKMPPTKRQLIFQKRELGAGADISKIKAGAVVFGLNWQGVNYVRNGQTIINRVILSKLPYKPQGADGKNDINHVLRKTVQGIMRGIRFDHDKPEIWCMDYRLREPLSGLVKLDGNLSDAVFRLYPNVPIHRFTDDFEISSPIIY